MRLLTVGLATTPLVQIYVSQDYQTERNKSCYCVRYQASQSTHKVYNRARLNVFSRQQLVTMLSCSLPSGVFLSSLRSPGFALPLLSPRHRLRLHRYAAPTPSTMGVPTSNASCHRGSPDPASGSMGFEAAIDPTMQHTLTLAVNGNHREVRERTKALWDTGGLSTTREKRNFREKKK